MGFPEMLADGPERQYLNAESNAGHEERPGSGLSDSRPFSLSYTFSVPA